MNVNNNRRTSGKNKEAMRLSLQLHVCRLYIVKNVDASEVTLYPGRLLGDQKLNYSKKKKLLTQLLLRQCLSSTLCQSFRKERNNRRKQLNPQQLAVGATAALTRVDYYRKTVHHKSPHRKHRNSLKEWKE